MSLVSETDQREFVEHHSTTMAVRSWQTTALAAAAVALAAAPLAYYQWQRSMCVLVPASPRALTV